ncbi:hypothetical protein KFE98_15075 [bacterium SCSIO 12741]|nr:hypothetical protein KFE98_15075 [bacterium SCSIO 12741]
MGSFIEVNDTLPLTVEQGFPANILDINRQSTSNPVTLKEVEGRIFEFHNKPSARIFQRDPVRLYLVQKIDGKWLFWGHALLQTQQWEKTDPEDNDSWTTSGSYIINKIYDPEYQKAVTINESVPGLSYF